MKYIYILQKLLFLLLAEIFFAVRVISQCHQLTLTSTQNYVKLNGNYQYYCQKDDGKPIYKHTDRNTYIYASYHNNSLHWTVGPKVSGQDSYLKSEEWATSPDKVENSWKAWSRKENRWLNDSAKITCSDCKAVLLEGFNVPEGLKGRYHSLNLIHNRRPIYKHHSNTLYLHYTNCNKWVVGPKVGQNIGAMYSISNSTTPWGIAETWTVFLPTETLKTNDVNATCTESPNVFKPDSPKVCGVNSIDKDIPVPYILGSSEVTKGKFPWMVSVMRPDNVHRCGGVLIASKWVLTAGHCINSNSLGESNDTVILGAHNIDLDKEPGRQVYNIKKTYRHPNFTFTNFPFEVRHDLGILELEDHVKYDSLVQPVCLPDSPALQFINQAAECLLVGWGQVGFRTKVGGTLKELRGRVIDATECARTRLPMLQHWLPTTSSLCVLPKNYGKICTGDSGGPLLCVKDGHWYGVGIASWVIVACLQTNLPSVYMDITADLPWIRSVCQC